MVASMLVQALYNIVDSIFVGWYDLNALTAVSLAFPYQNLMIAVASGTGVGMNALLSKSLGEREYKKANIVAGNGIVLAIISTLVFVVLGITVTEAFFRIQNPNANIVAYGKDYLTICSCFSFGIFGQFIFERMLQSTGKTIYSMFSQVMGAGVNLILDPIMIFGYFGFPQMGVKGAAAATVIGQITAMIAAFCFNHKFNEYIKLCPEIMKLKKDIVKKIYSVGIPSILMVAIGSVMTFCFNKILVQFDAVKTVYGKNAGTIATTVFGVYFKLQSFIFMPVFGINNGMVPIIAYNYGARKKERITKTMTLSMTYATILMMAGIALFQLIPDKLISMFNDNASLKAMGIPALRIISISFLFAGFCIISSSVFQALGKGHYSLIVSAARQLLLIIPVAYLLSRTGNPNLVWLSFPIAEIASLILCIFFIKRIFKRIAI
ncbi:MAG: MATE family efflux transporter, partial [Clostridia bacterium]|nr:MATE family efflux transporter [Clostridia bacterium]